VQERCPEAHVAPWHSAGHRSAPGIVLRNRAKRTAVQHITTWGEWMSEDAPDPHGKAFSWYQVRVSQWSEADGTGEDEIGVCIDQARRLGIVEKTNERRPGGFWELEGDIPWTRLWWHPRWRSATWPACQDSFGFPSWEGLQ